MQTARRLPRSLRMKTRKKGPLDPAARGVARGIFFLSFLIGRYRVPALQVLRLLTDRFLSIVSFGRWGLAPTWTAEEASVVVQIRLPRILSAALIGAALCRGRVVSGDVPQPHGLAGSARRVHGRVLRRGAGDFVRRKLRGDHGKLVPFLALRPWGSPIWSAGSAASARHWRWCWRA